MAPGTLIIIIHHLLDYIIYRNFFNVVQRRVQSYSNYPSIILFICLVTSFSLLFFFALQIAYLILIHEGRNKRLSNTRVQILIKTNYIEKRESKNTKVKSEFKI